MDILNPELVWIKNRCYRNLAKTADDDISRDEEVRRAPPAAEWRMDEDDFVDDINLDIRHADNIFFLNIPIPKEFIGFIKGKKGQTWNRIQGRYVVELDIPETKMDNDTYKKTDEVNLSIKSDEKDNIIKAFREIDSITKDARWKVGEFTHFVSIPMNDRGIQQGFETFKKDVLNNCRNSRGVNIGLFEIAPKLHLTITMLTLLTKREKETAKSMLQKHRTDFMNLLGGKRFCVEVKGVEYMNDDPTEVDVLYGKVRETDDDNCLQIIANKLSDTFAAENYARGSEEVKLHLTLMKSRTEKTARVTFDATQILEKYQNFTFGQTEVTEIHISVRYTGGNSSYYIPLCVMNLKDL